MKGLYRIVVLLLVSAVTGLALASPAPGDDPHPAAGAPPTVEVADPDETHAHCPFRPGDGAGEASLASEQMMVATPCVGGFAGPYPCSNVDLMAQVPLASMGCSAGNSLWGWTDSLTGKEYALMGCNNGIAFVDITTPASPVYLGKLPTHTVSSSWRDVRVYANHAYIISEASGHGMQVFDLTRLRSVVSPPVTFTEDAHYAGFGNAHTIAINEATGFAYPVGTQTCFGGLHMLNIQNPKVPVFAGCVNQDGYTHETQCAIYHGEDVAYQGHEICFNSNEDTLTIVDVTVKNAPVQLSRTGYAGSAYTHQGWLTEDHRYFILDDELDEVNQGHPLYTFVFDLADLNAPVMIGTHQSALTAIDHNQYVVGHYLYQANYRSGLRILDIANVASHSFTEVAYFDIYPANNNPNFNGAWNNYPFFQSGNVIVSGIGEGLFILHPTLIADFGLSIADATLAVCAGGGSDGTVVDVFSRNGYAGVVTLSAIDLPAGVTADFGTNPVVVPDTSPLTVTVGGVPAGNYPLAVRGEDGTSLHSADVMLSVSQPVGGAPALVLPPNGAIDQPLSVTLRWNAVSGAATYQLQVDDDPSFASPVYSATVATTTTVSPGLPSDTLFHWRVRAQNICGTGAYSVTRTFRTRQTPPILLVDDDDNQPDTRSYYTAALTALGASYDVWDTLNSASFAPEHQSEPDASTLANYRAVIWFSGDVFATPEDPHAGPSPASEGALGTYLDDGKCFVLSSEDYFYDRGSLVSPFMANYLGLGSNAETGQTGVTGTGAFAGLGPYTFVDPPMFGNFSDELTVGPGGAAAFMGSTGIAGISKSAAYKTVYMAFPVESLPTPTARTDVMHRLLGFCGSGPGEAMNLSVAKTATDLVFTWSVPQGACQNQSYALYRGSLAPFVSGQYSHDTSLACGIVGTSWQTPLSNPQVGTADYFLIVAEGATTEGSYGKSSTGERPRGSSSCKPSQDLTGCF